MLARALGWLVFACAMCASIPAQAERLAFDHRTYPPLKATFDSRNGDLIRHDGGNPRYIYNLVVVQGRSTESWTEALEIVTRVSARKLRTAADWLDELRGRDAPGCATTFVVIAEDENSLTFERLSPGCPERIAASGLYRVIAGARSLFLLGALYRGQMSPAMRSEWLGLLATARIEN